MDTGVASGQDRERCGGPFLFDRVKTGAPGGEKDEACVKAGLDKVADQLK
jgi:hypothetical protein